MTYITKENIINRIVRPSEAVHAMIEGLREWSQNPVCRIDMQTFGNSRLYPPEDERSAKEICFGCAATATAYKLYSDIFTVQDAIEIYKSQNNPGLKDLAEFESIINDVRCGDWIELLKYYYLNPHRASIPTREPLTPEEREKGSYLYDSILLRRMFPEMCKALVKLTLPVLNTKDWQENIHYYEALRDTLIEFGA